MKKYSILLILLFTLSLGRVLPPIQFTLTTNTQITRKTLPRKNNYVDVAVWLEEEKLIGNDYYAEAGYNRTLMCEDISKVLGWTVDQNSLQHAQNRRKK